MVVCDVDTYRSLNIYWESSFTPPRHTIMFEYWSVGHIECVTKVIQQQYISSQTPTNMFSSAKFKVHCGYSSIYKLSSQLFYRYRLTTWSRFECFTRWHLLGWIWQTVPPLCGVSAGDSPGQGAFPVSVQLPSEKHYKNTWNNNDSLTNKRKKEYCFVLKRVMWHLRGHVWDDGYIEVKIVRRRLLSYFLFLNYFFHHVNLTGKKVQRCRDWQLRERKSVNIIYFNNHF